ncbi:MAG: sulfatase [Myxococcota bacterium]|nr:sulfatase [Myxococcota bacterium]
MTERSHKRKGRLFSWCLAVVLLTLVCELELLGRQSGSGLILLGRDYLAAIPSLLPPLLCFSLVSLVVVVVAQASLFRGAPVSVLGLGLLVALDTAGRVLLTEAWLGSAAESHRQAAVLPGLLYAVLLPSLPTLAGLWILTRGRIATPFVLPLLAGGLVLLFPFPGAGEGPPSGTAAAPTSIEAGPGAERNLLLVTIDTWRYDHLSAHPRAVQEGLTPEIDALSRRGLLFTQARSHAPITVPSHASILSGLAPWDHGVLSNAGRLDDAMSWLPERLSKAGYETGAVVSGAVLRGDKGFARGFDYFHDELHDPPGLDDLVALRLERLIRGLPQPRTFRAEADRALARAEAFLERSSGPWFLWVHLYDVHLPHSAPPAEVQPFESGALSGLPDPCAYADHPAVPVGPGGMPIFRRGRDSRDCAASPPFIQKLASYRAEVARSDRAVGALVDAVERSAWGGLERTAVIVTSDHGESLTEHSTRLSHQFSSYETVLRVPLVVVPPGGVSPVERRDLVELRDLPATAAGLLGIDWSGPGTSWLAPSVQDEPVGSIVRIPPSVIGKLPPDPVAASAPPVPGQHGLRITVRDGRRCLLRGAGRPDELYDLEADPSQVTELLSSGGATEPPASLLLAVDSIEDRVSKPGGLKLVEPRDEELEALRALGYVE